MTFKLLNPYGKVATAKGKEGARKYKKAVARKKAIKKLFGKEK